MLLACPGGLTCLAEPVLFIAHTGGEVSQCFPAKVRVHGEEELSAQKGGEGGISR